MKTKIEIHGEGIGPRGTTTIRLTREFPGLKGARYKLIRDAFYSSVNKVRQTDYLQHFNVGTGNDNEEAMLWAFYDPKYDSAENPVKEYPTAQEVLDEFDAIYNMAKTYLEKSFIGEKLSQKFCIYPLIHCHVEFNAEKDLWVVRLTTDWRYLPENAETKFSDFPKGMNTAQSYVVKEFMDEEIESVTEQDVQDAYNELYELVRNNKFMADAMDMCKNKLVDFQNRYVLKQHIYCNYSELDGFRGKFGIHNSRTNIAEYPFESAKEAFEVAQSIDFKQLLELAEKNDLIDKDTPTVVPKSKAELESDRKKQIAKLKKRTEVKYEDFILDLQRLAKQD